jgi:hypothetical protein
MQANPPYSVANEQNTSLNSPNPRKAATRLKHLNRNI